MQVAAISLHGGSAWPFSESNLLHREGTRFPGDLFPSDGLTVGVGGVNYWILGEADSGKQSRSGGSAKCADEVSARE